MTTNTRFLATTVVAAMGLTGCNWNDDDPDINVSELQKLDASGEKLVKLGEESARTLIRNGLVLSSIESHTSCNNCSPALAETVDASVSASSTADSGYSGTTTQEVGVDESDRVKYDGDHLFLASNHYDVVGLPVISEGNENDPRMGPHIRILSRNGDDTLTESAIVGLGESATGVNELYVNDGKMAAIYQVYEPEEAQGDSSSENHVAVSLVPADMWYPYQQKFGLNFSDVSDVNSVQELASYTIDGYVLSSRRIGDKLYLVSSYAPQLDIQSWPESTIQQQAVYEELSKDDSLKLLPSIRNGQEKADLVSASDCYIPQLTDETAGYGSVVTLTTFDLNEPDKHESVCLLSPVDGFYASQEAVYFYATAYQEPDEPTDNWQASTVIHKFSYLDNSVDYAATGQVKGHVGWQNSHLRFSEKSDLLRVVTSQRDEQTNDLEHMLFVLEPNDIQELELIAHLPNDKRTAKIGKPGEDVYAVRYFGDKAYIVTFERIDPLYVLDLSEPRDPKLAGELEVPGYSAYLQPLSDDFVLGIGQQIDPNTSNNNIVEGAKIELYDVSDMQSPQVVSTLVFENGYTPAEWDYHALTQLKTSEDKYKMALPVYSWQTEQVGQDSWEWQRQNTMRLIDVDISSSNPGLAQAGSLNVKDDYYGNWGDRAVLHGDIVYYVRHNSVWQSYWSTPNIINGPF